MQLMNKTIGGVPSIDPGAISAALLRACLSWYRKPSQDHPGHRPHAAASFERMQAPCDKTLPAALSSIPNSCIPGAPNLI
ncbi:MULTISPECIES: hypothetical protein [unclassified Bradyrhizobium]|uniref:hypothetical protein n=1 Tax=unclassified Bradyrhizobium TaxID=2631580 RepID=UPI0028E871A1|nr:MULTISPECIES: hypothetical protein [unclassified Bradyrhizobium]